MRCKHEFEVIGNDYVLGTDYGFKSINTHSTQDSKLFTELLEKQRLGTTTLTQRCKKCKKVFTDVVLGRVVGV